MYKVKNIDKTVQVLQDKGKTIAIKPGETVLMVNPPKDSYIFKVTKTEVEEEKKEKKSKKEVE